MTSSPSPARDRLQQRAGALGSQPLQPGARCAGLSAKPIRSRPATAHQLRYLEFIVDEESVARVPTIRELGANFGVGTQAVVDVLDALCRKGLLTRTKNKARSMRVTEAGLRVLQVPRCSKCGRPGKGD